MAKQLPLKSFRVKNFKAIRDSGVVEFTPLTVLIGDNGSGKSSLIEGLQTYQRIVTDGLDAAMGMWRGFEFIRNAEAPQQADNSAASRAHQRGAIEFFVSQCVASENELESARTHAQSLKVACAPDGDEIFILEEDWKVGGRKYMRRDAQGNLHCANGEGLGSASRYSSPYPHGFDMAALPSGKSLINGSRAHFGALDAIASWQFLTLNAWSMGEPNPVQRTGGAIRLRSDGSNIAEYLNDIRARDEDAFDGILETMQYVLPQMQDLRPVLSDVLGHQMHLQLTERDNPVMGWLLSTGTLRILALLALFRHPEPPPLIVIEELENGLDPRSVQLIVEEIRRVTESGRSQIILTSHSPYLLDLFDLSHIVLVERRDGAPTFTRPDECRDLDRWKERFGPGRLMSSGRLRNRELA